MSLDPQDLESNWVKVAKYAGDPVPVQISQQTGDAIAISYSDPITFPRSYFDAFNRLRVSNPETIFESKPIYGKDVDQWTESTTGGGNSTYNTTTGQVDLTTGTANGDEVIRQTYRYHNYSPGKSFQWLMTFVLGAQTANTTKRVGYFDANNGIFLEQTGSGLSLVLRSNTSGSPVDQKIPQASWNMDTMDGTGPSGYTLDPTKTWIFGGMLQWLGVGSIWLGFEIDGMFVVAHRFDHANRIGVIYMKTPNLPIRYQMTNTGTSAGGAISAICANIIREGGADIRHQERAADRGISGVSIGTTTAPIISIRLADASYYVRIMGMGVMVTTNNLDFRWAIISNATLTSPNWVTSGRVQYDVTASALSGGTVLMSGYEARTSRIVGESLVHLRHLGRAIDGTSEIITLAGQAVSSSGTFLGSLQWEEPS